MEKNKKRKQKATMGKVLHYIRPYWPFLVLSVLAAAITVTGTLYVPIVTGDALDYIIEKGKVDFDYVGQKLMVIADDAICFYGNI